MRVREIFGETIKLEEDDYASIVSRFNFDNAKFNRMNREWVIEEDCYLCQKYRNLSPNEDSCSKCPLYVFQYAEGALSCAGCINLLIMIAEEHGCDQSPYYLRLGGYVRWYDFRNEEVFKLLRVVQDELKKFNAYKRKDSE